MKLAVTYDQGNVFQHFGRTEFFKIYEIEDEKITSTEIISAGGAGHGALAGVLAEQGVDLLICGGIGGGAQAALAEAGIGVCAGAEGDTDKAVLDYISRRLTDTGVNCSHHGGEHACGDHGCGSEDDPSCGHACGQDGSGCAGCKAGPQITGPNVGKTCRVHYRGTLNDGTQFDCSYDRGETLDFVCGAGMMIPGFDQAVALMEVGQVADIHLMPEEAYGMPDPNAVFTVSLEAFPEAKELAVGQQVYLQSPAGHPFLVRVAAKDEEAITFDANHELAGQELNFRIELIEVV